MAIETVKSMETEMAERVMRQAREMRVFMNGLLLGLGRDPHTYDTFFSNVDCVCDGVIRQSIEA